MAVQVALQNTNNASNKQPSQAVYHHKGYPGPWHAVTSRRLSLPLASWACPVGGSGQGWAESVSIHGRIGHSQFQLAHTARSGCGRGVKEASSLGYIMGLMVLLFSTWSCRRPSWWCHGGFCTVVLVILLSFSRAGWGRDTRVEMRDLG